MIINDLTLEQARSLYRSGINQKDFAKILGIDEVRYQRIENGTVKMSASELVSLVSAFKDSGKDLDVTKLKL